MPSIVTLVSASTSLTLYFVPAFLAGVIGMAAAGRLDAATKLWMLWVSMRLCGVQVGSWVGRGVGGRIGSFVSGWVGRGVGRGIDSLVRGGGVGRQGWRWGYLGEGFAVLRVLPTLVDTPLGISRLRVLHDHAVELLVSPSLLVEVRQALRVLEGGGRGGDLRQE